MHTPDILLVVHWGCWEQRTGSNTTLWGNCTSTPPPKGKWSPGRCALANTAALEVIHRQPFHVHRQLRCGDTGSTAQRRTARVTLTHWYNTTCKLGCAQPQAVHVQVSLPPCMPFSSSSASFMYSNCAKRSHCLQRRHQQIRGSTQLWQTRGANRLLQTDNCALAAAVAVAVAVDGTYVMPCSFSSCLTIMGSRCSNSVNFCKLKRMLKNAPDTSATNDKRQPSQDRHSHDNAAKQCHRATPVSRTRVG